MNNIEPNEIVVVDQEISLTFPVYTFDLADYLDIELLKSNIRALQEKFPVSTKTNVICDKGWRSPYFFTGVNQEIEFFSSAINIIQKTTKTIDSTLDVKVVNLWAMIYKNLDRAEWHNHGSLWDRLCFNVVLYLTKSQTPLIIKTKVNKDLCIYPEIGKLVVMHPLTMHSVPAVKDEERIVLAANLAF